MFPIVSRSGKALCLLFLFGFYKEKRKEENSIKRKTAVLLTTLTIIAALFAGCGNESAKGAKEEGDSGENGIAYTIGISQFAEHGSLDNCREGFLKGLEEEGIVEGKNLKVVYDNAQTDTGTAGTIAEGFVSQNVDLVCAIATPCAMSAYNACMETEIPVVYTAVSDPAEAGLADGEGNPVGNITGSSDILPVEEQLGMIRKLMPEAKKIGIIYTTSEANSVSTIAAYKELAGEYGFEIVDTGITAPSEVELAAADLVTKVDCITNLTDNTVVDALQTVLAIASEKKVPVFGSEIEQVKSGCVASMGIEYVELGRQTGVMAAKILKGEAKAEETPFIAATEAELYINTAAAEQIGMELDGEYLKDAAETFTELAAE